MAAEPECGQEGHDFILHNLHLTESPSLVVVYLQTQSKMEGKILYSVKAILY